MQPLPHFEGTGRTLFRAAREHDLEGILWRSTSWASTSPDARRRRWSKFGTGVIRSEKGRMRCLHVPTSRQDGVVVRLSRRGANNYLGY